MAPLLDDSPGQLTMAPCTCLSLMYLTVTELQSVQSFHFPQVVVPLRKAMGVLSELINCPQCPKDNFSAIQNIASVVALCKAIIERFNKVLMVIDKEAERLEQSGEKKPYRIGDNSPELQHLHTGTLDCPMGFNIEIELRSTETEVIRSHCYSLYRKQSRDRKGGTKIRIITVQRESISLVRERRVIQARSAKRWVQSIFGA
jgi:hypothetical protein